MKELSNEDRATNLSAAMPVISIVTICKNASATIERTLTSVAQCSYPRLQYVVVDGGSTDDTVAKIGLYRSRIDKFISEPDDGISDALNKAVALTDGDYHLVVHADDALMPDSLARMIQHASGRMSEVICGSVSVIGDDRLYRVFVPEPEKLLSKMSVPHMGSLIRRDAWEAAGGYDVRRKVAMDHKLMLKILSRSGLEAFSVVDVTVAKYFLGGISDRQVYAGILEVRDNLVEQGVGKFRANSAYIQLLIKARMARILRRC